MSVLLQDRQSRTWSPGNRAFQQDHQLFPASITWEHPRVNLQLPLHEITHLGKSVPCPVFQFTLLSSDMGQHWSEFVWNQVHILCAVARIPPCSPVLIQQQEHQINVFSQSSLRGAQEASGKGQYLHPATKTWFTKQNTQALPSAGHSAAQNCTSLITSSAMFISALSERHTQSHRTTCMYLYSFVI